MLSRIINIPSYLNLTNIGIVEFLFSLALLLGGFNLGGIPMSFFIWGSIILIIFFRSKHLKIENYPPITLFFVYWIFHELIVIFFDANVNLKGYVEQLLLFVSFYFLYPYLNLNKLRGSLNWIAIIAIMGLLYQWSIISRGGSVHPLEIPGLSMSDNRLESLTIRPSSFFMEPAAYVAFMLCPLALALLDKKYIWVIIIILSIFLTTSTTGLILSFVILMMSLIIARVNKLSIFVMLISGFGLYYTLTHFDAFKTGVQKYENTDIETTIRLVQGPKVVKTMELYEYAFGAPYSSAYNYCKDRNVKRIVYYGNSVYMSTFWLLILRFGIAGLLLYLYIYYKIIQSSRLTIPLSTCLLVVMFSSSYALGATYIFSLLFLLTICRYEESIIPEIE